MKKLLVIFSILIISLTIGFTCVNAYSDTYTLELETVSNKNNKPFDLYLLLPKDYIVFAINEDNLTISYQGADTLKQNEIPSIAVKKENVKEDVYIEDGIEYVQILLDKNSENKYVFEILSDYTNMNMKYRIKNIEKDYIMHIDNFKIVKGKCEIEYNYDSDNVKQPDIKIVPFTTKVLIAILVVIIVIGLIAYVKQRR